jgi:inhibitor of KinA sporulation pathway (predicted exonuclease)
MKNNKHLEENYHLLSEKNKQIEILKMQQIELDSSLSDFHQKSQTWEQRVKRANIQIQKQVKINMKKKIKSTPEYIQIDLQDLNSYFKKFYGDSNNENINTQNVDQGIQFRKEYEEQLNRTLKRIL